MEFDLNGVLTWCTVHAEDIDIDNFLLGGVHTVRDCLLADGQPMPTAEGLICRMPLLGRPNVSGTIPPCPVAGWVNAGSGLYKYNTTYPVTLPLTRCKNDKFDSTTEWHSMARLPIEFKEEWIQKNTSKTLSYILGGTAFTSLVVVALVPGLGTVIAAVAAIIGFIFSLFRKCKEIKISFHAQVSSVGCQ
jgi:hypothetical protein